MEILVIEDERKLATAIVEGLQQDRNTVLMAHTGELGLKMLHQGRFDLLVLDLMLPKMDGLSVLRELRCDGYGLPVLILSAKDLVEERVLGLDS